MTSKIDELSQALDKINAGRDPLSKDGECADLLEVAALLQKSGLPVHPPEHILSATVNRAAEGLAEHNKTRRNAWMYSGLLGAAAAMLIFVGIHGFPSIQDTSTIVTPAPQDIPASSQAETRSDDRSSLPVSPAKESKVSPAEPIGITPESLPAATARPLEGPVASHTPPIPDQTINQTPAVPQSTRQAPSPVPSIKEALPPPSSKQASLEAFIALRPPDRHPDSIVRDHANGILRQVFDRGTPRELIITQRLILQVGNNTAAQTKQNILQEADRGGNKALGGPNKLVVFIRGQEVTLEGQQTLQELTELAKILKPENM